MALQGKGFIRYFFLGSKSSDPKSCAIVRTFYMVYVYVMHMLHCIIAMATIQWGGCFISVTERRRTGSWSFESNESRILPRSHTNVRNFILERFYDDDDHISSLLIQPSSTTHFIDYNTRITDKNNVLFLLFGFQPPPLMMLHMWDCIMMAAFASVTFVFTTTERWGEICETVWEKYQGHAYKSYTRLRPPPRLWQDQQK
jgi:hypothetical protein